MEIQAVSTTATTVARPTEPVRVAQLETAAPTPITRDEHPVLILLERLAHMERSGLLIDTQA